MRYDLHSHTNCSDGEKTVAELIALAKEVGLSGLSITDHDTIQAYETAFDEADQHNLELLTGLELSCVHDQKSVHLLVYAFDEQNQALKDYVDHCQELRRKRNVEMIQRLNHHGVSISQQEIEKRFNQPLKQLGRPHFATYMIEQKIVASKEEAFSRYIADGKKCFVLGERPEAEQAIEFMHSVNAFVVLAHPHLISDQTLIQGLLKLNLDGIEGYYAKMSPPQEKRWVDLAQKKGWLVTGGSDYHGSMKPMNNLGCSWVNQETFKVLIHRYHENCRLSKHQ